MNCIDHVKVGKYEVIIRSGEDKFEFKALRNDELWMEHLELVEGSNLIMTMAYEIQRLRNELNKE